MLQLIHTSHVREISNMAIAPQDRIELLTLTNTLSLALPLERLVQVLSYFRFQSPQVSQRGKFVTHTPWMARRETKVLSVDEKG